MSNMIDRNVANGAPAILSRRRAWLAATGFVALLACASTSPATAATCQFVGGPQFGGSEPPLAIDAICTDPDYNATTFVIDSTQQQTLTLPDGTTIPYTEVKGHFPVLKKPTELPPGITHSPTTASHSVFWRFPDKKYWHNRFLQQTYPLPIDILNTVDNHFAFTNGGYTVGVSSGSPTAGYRVIAAAAKLAKEYANKLYGNTGRVYGYLFGASGGSVQSIGASEGTAGVWDGIIPVVIATDGLNVHSFAWDGFLAVAIPKAKLQAIAEAAAPGSGRDIYADLNSEEHAALDEVLNAGFPRIGFESVKSMPLMSVSNLMQGSIRTFDPTYEDDFWSKPGYEGVNPPSYLAAAKVDGYATITGIERDAQNLPKAITFDPATVPPLGSIGADGLEYYVFAADGTTRVTKGEAVSLLGKLNANTLTLDTNKTDPALLNALTIGGKIRINNRFVLAVAFYPRHSILDNGNPAYNQYKNADGTWKYVQRPQTPIAIPYINNVSASGGRRQTGHLTVKTIVLENLADPASWPYVGGFYAEQVQKAMGPHEAKQMFRLYYQENATHGATPTPLPGKFGTTLAPVGGILNQALLDLAAWVERGVAPLPSTSYKRDAMNQVVLPENASKRYGLQPVMHLTADGKIRAEGHVNQPVNLVATIAMPPGAGKIVQYDWYLGGSDYKFEPMTMVAKPETVLTVKRTVSFPAPGEYSITLRASGQRQGNGDANGTTFLTNLARVRVVVR